MKKVFALLFLLFLISLSFSVQAQTGLSLSIRSHLVVIDDNQGNFPSDKNVRFYREIFDFYKNRYYKAFWTEGGMFNQKFAVLLEEIDKSYKEGLNPRDYHIEFINELLAEDIFAEDNTDMRAMFEIYATDAYLNLAADYLSGKLNPEVILGKGNLSYDSLNFDELFSALTEEKNIAEVLQEQLPSSRDYRKLKEKLHYYRDSGKISAWNKIRPGGLLALKAEGERVKQLIDNLAARNYLNKADISDPYFFDEQLKNALQRFQRDNGLKTDGIVGFKTLETLNIPYSRRVKQIIINMERWRWLPEDLGKKYLYVNIADYNLKLIENETTLMSMKTIVGHRQRSTPVFSDRIEYLVFNPYWYVPKKIAVEDKLPILKENPQYLDENNYTVLQYSSNNKLEKVNAEKIDWQEINKDNFNYILRQEPGDINALGRVKFMFPNKFSVYLHDTPSKGLFEENERGFSSGCIRIERPFDLAEYLLKDNSSWNRKRINEILKSGEHRIVYLQEQMPIFIQYNTSWVDRSGHFNFRQDIYNRDEKLISLYFEEKKE